MSNNRTVKIRRASGTDWFNALSYNGKTYDGTDDGTGWKGIPYLLPDDDQGNQGNDEKKGKSTKLWIIAGAAVLLIVLIVVILLLIKK